MISAFAFGGTPREAVRRTFREARICVSADLLQEYRDVPSALHAAGKITSQQFKALIAGIAAVMAAARMVHPKKRLTICRDPKDDMVLECCMAADARWLVTGDKDLLSIESLPFGTIVLTPEQYVALPSDKGVRRG